MNTCNKCHGRGFIEEIFIKDNRTHRVLKQCCDISAYSKEIQNRNCNVETLQEKINRLIGR